MESNTATVLDRAPATLDNLRAAIQGEVFTSESEGYDQARHAWNLTVNQHPAIIVVAANVADIQTALAYAQSNNLPVAVQSTGHGMPRCCNGALLIRTGQLKDVLIDAENRTARIGAGAKWQDVLEPAQQYGLAALSGSAPHVGVIGYTLGGGFGLMTRKYGLSIDQIISLKLVTASGEHLTVSPSENPDLFWAIRGGGGGFGVITEIEINLLPEPEVFGGAILYPHHRAPEIYKAYLAWCQTAPEEATTSISVMTFPPAPFVPEPLRGQSVVMINGCVTGDPGKAEEILLPLRSLGQPIMDLFARMPYSESHAIYRDPIDPMPGMMSGILISDLDEAALETLLTAIGPIPEMPSLKIELRHLGGAMHRYPSNASAFGSRREANYLLYHLGLPIGPGVSERLESHAEHIFEALNDCVICPGPLNFLGEGAVKASKIRAVFTPEDYDRLIAIKHSVNPKNLFQMAGIGIPVAESL